ncbi:dethiobiotin synthase [Myroides phaeus]|uniref:dethiobiotin synthase n=1 Tax=Myroides phaeus TaxID=702745 RepID=UPI002DBBDB93|nr:dethiobiotin synthase [Myroides phaeus]MEC4117516.1 dethiobiotin synthase [Myroides phaeus]
MKQQLFITGIGTEIGKTVVSAAFVQRFQADYWKPVQSGDLHLTDTEKVSKLVDSHLVAHPESYRFELAASPHKSARKEGVTIEDSKIKLPQTANNLIVEGAGGLYVPMAKGYYMIDLIERLALPTVLVVRNYLGCINHAILSIEALKVRHIPIAYLVLNGEFDSDTYDAIVENIDSTTQIVRLPELTEVNAKAIKKISQYIK